MVIAIFGENCTGKSTLAEKLKAEFDGVIYTGKDYLRFAKSAFEAEKIFKEKLCAAADVEASAGGAIGGENIFYIISEKIHLDLLPEKCFKILVTAELSVIKQRFAARMRGNLPPPVEAMLEKNHGAFDNEAHNFHYENAENYADLILKIRGTYAN